MSNEIKYDEIKHLQPKDHIKLRFGMYGSSKETPLSLFKESLDNSIDEAMVGFCKNIHICINKESYIIEDDGRGIPLGIDEKTGKCFANTAITELNSSGKYDNNAYTTSGGINGVGSKLITYCSDYYKVNTWRDKQEYLIELRNGNIINESLAPSTKKSKSGTYCEVFPLTKWEHPITHEKYDKFFDSLELPLEVILERLRLVKTQIPKVKIFLKHYSDLRFTDYTEVLPFNDSEILSLKEGVKTFEISSEIKTPEDKKGESFTIKFGFDPDKIQTKSCLSTVNMLKIIEGVHIESAKWSFIDAFKEYVDKDTKQFLQDTDYLTGFHYSVFVNLKKPEYNSQTKEKLVGGWVSYQYLRDEMIKQFSKWLWKSENRDFVLQLINRMKLVRENANKSGNFKLIEKEIQFGDVEKSDDGSGFKVSRKLSSISNGKLVECSGNNVNGTSLFICEGASASSGLIKKRDPKKHAILQLRGKILNCIDMDPKDIIKNLEWKLLINTIGCGCLSNVDISKCRYDKICICVDADEDGYQISALLIGGLSYLIPELIEQGKLFIVKTPLFIQVDEKGNELKVYKESDLNHDFKIKYRWKGLGAINLERIPELFYNESTAVYQKITFDDVEDCQKVCDLVGNSEPKKQLLLNRGILKDN